MRIGLVIYGSLDTISGGYLYDRKLVAYLKGQGDSVEVVSLPYRDYLRHLSDNASPALYRRLAELRVDVLLQDELNHPSLFLMNRRLRDKVEYPIVSIVHHLRSSEDWPAWQNRPYRWVERKYLASVDAFVYNSQATERAVEKLLRDDGKKCPYVIAHPAGDRLGPEIDHEEIAQRARRGALRILFLGNIIPRKGLHILLEALKGLPAGERELAVVGSGDVDSPYLRAINRLIERNGMSGCVRLAGAIGDRELAQEMKASHVLAIPSSYEGYGIAYLEGMGFGLPAIGTAAGGTREVISHGRDGFLISPGDTAALASYLKRLAEDRELLLRMGLAALDRYNAHPTWEDSMKAIRAFLSDIKG